MERKIGEIFEYNGEWYQCLESHSCRCDYCEFYELAHCHEIACASVERFDNMEVYFKKLEKVGEPYVVHDHSRNEDVTVQDYKLYKSQGACYDGHETLDFCPHGKIEEIVAIEIKQNKEYMEEKNDIKLNDLVNMHVKEIMDGNKTPLPKEDNALTRAVYSYVNGEISDEELIKTIKEMSKEYPYYNSRLKPFSLEAARSGKPVCTRDGRKVRIICFDAKDNLPIIALITNARGDESLARYKSNGRFINLNESDCDLMMLPEKKEGWVNVYDADTTFYFVEGMVYDTKEEAIKHINPDHEIYITTVKIEWEE